MPDATETLKWNQPAIIDTDGVILAVYSAHKQHMNLVVTPSALDALRDTFSDYKTGKGSVQLPYDSPLPKTLLRNLMEYRVKEHRKSGVSWM